MTRLWRLTRNRYGRWLYETLAARGIRVSKLVRYVRDCSEPVAVTPTAPVEVTVHSAGDDDVATFTEPAAGDEVIVARDGDTIVGHCFLSADREVYVEELESNRSFDGAYIWRVFVEPSHRRQGVATALLATALETAGVLDARRAVALVAVDNYPSKRLFERFGFESDRVLSYYQLRSWTYRNTRQITRDGGRVFDTG